MPYAPLPEARSRHGFAPGVLALLVLWAVAACSETAPPSDPWPLHITRTGGFAGVSQSINVDRDGAWVYTDYRAGETDSGVLTAAERDRLLRALQDPDFPTQLANPVEGTCADAFNYTFAGEVSGIYEDCLGGRPAVAEVIAAVADATAF